MSWKRYLPSRGRYLWLATILLVALVSLYWLIFAKRGPGPPVPRETAILFDVHGLHGGENVWASADGKAWVQVVRPGSHASLQEKRYRIQLPEGWWAEVERLVGLHNFLSLKMKLRWGVPDEALALIAVVSKTGVRTSVGNWKRDPVPDFDALYGHLRTLKDPMAGAELVFEGEFDWDWHPPDYPSLRETQSWK